MKPYADLVLEETEFTYGVVFPGKPAWAHSLIHDLELRAVPIADTALIIAEMASTLHKFATKLRVTLS